MNVHVLVPAAGSGRRIGGTISKQYLELGERPILAHTLVRLAAVECVTQLHLIVPEADISDCRTDIIARHQITKVAGIIAGGAERQDSVRHGLLACGADDSDIVMIHDGVRPFFPADRIVSLIEAAEADGAALLAIPAQDTIKEVDGDRVQRTLDRRRLWQVQTPQAFRFAVICEAHMRAQAAGYHGTDDASLVEWCGSPVRVITGSAHNFKITTPADLALARALLAVGEVTLT